MAERVAILRKSSLGDVVLVGSITDALPGAVTVVTHPRYAEVAAKMRGVDRVLPWPDGVPDWDVDRIVDLQGNPASRWLLRSFRGPVSRIRKRPVLRRLSVMWGIGPGRPSVPELYGEAAGVQPAERPWLDVPDRPRDTLLVAPGASWAPKRWHANGFAMVAAGWDGPVVVVGSAGERVLVEQVAATVPGARAVAGDGFSWAWELLARTRVAVVNDSGWMHLAGATGAKVVALFGPTSPRDGFAVYPGAVIERSVHCRPCALHRVATCKTGTLACQDHDPQAVIDAMNRCAGSS